MEQLIAQIAQAMAGQNAAQYDPDLMEQAGGASNLPMDTASQKRYESEQMRRQSLVDDLMAKLGEAHMSQAAPYNVGPSGYPQGGTRSEYRPTMR